MRTSRKDHSTFLLFSVAILGLSTLTGCGTRATNLTTVTYAPLPGGEWKVSTPAAQGVDPNLVARLYHDAAGLETLYALLVVKNDQLLAEKYFNAGAVDQLSGRQSATKSVTSALVGIALEEGCLSSVDQKMIEFFPESAGQITDARKKQITIRELLQMRAGFPWEELEPPYFDILFMHDNWQWLPHVVDVPLTSDPGAEFKYSNLTSHLLGIIVARACHTDLRSFAQEHVFSPIGAKVGPWTTDPNGYNWGHFEINLTARDMARFGLLYLHRGEYQGKRVISASWVEDSLRRYSEGINFTGWFSSKLGHYVRDVGYGYQWWSGRAGAHRFDFAWGHGGQLIVLVHDLNMVVVTTADPLYQLPGEAGWKHEGAIIDLVGRFIESLPRA
jgi:CubicO group peptidase (beta-lactamase class C family)